MPRHLMRTWYKTDVVQGDPAVGTFSASIPDRAFEDGTIVDVDWSVRGEVQVTFLKEGPGYNA
jgi:hypothetical protein